MFRPLALPIISIPIIGVNDARIVETPDDQLTEGERERKRELEKLGAGNNQSSSSLNLTDDPLIQLAILGLVLFTPRGREAFRVVEPVLMKLLDMLERSMIAMFEASVKQPALSIPATLLFTNMCEKMRLVDQNTAQVVATITTGLNTAEDITNILSKLASSLNPFKEMATTEGDIVFDVGGGEVERTHIEGVSRKTFESIVEKLTSEKKKP